MIKPTSGVKQRDPLSAVLFNLIMNRLIENIPDDIRIDLDGKRINIQAIGDDIILMASTSCGLQILLDKAF